MAALYAEQENYLLASDCLKKVIEGEEHESQKVGLLTKIAGNYKKANLEKECVDASQDAYDLMKRL